MIDLSHLKREHARWIQLHGGDPRSVSKGQLEDSRAIIQLIEALECAVATLELFAKDKFDGGAEGWYGQTAYSALNRISALIGKGEGAE